MLLIKHETNIKKEKKINTKRQISSIIMIDLRVHEDEQMHILIFFKLLSNI